MAITKHKINRKVSKDQQVERVWSHADVAIIFDVTRQAVHNWQKYPFTTSEVEAIVDLRVKETNGIVRRFQLMSDMIDRDGLTQEKTP